MSVAFGELLAAMHDAMRDDADLARAADDARFLRRQFGDHRLERLGEAALRQLAFHLALRPAMREPRAVDADALDQTARVAGFVGRVVEAVLERRRAAVDDEDLLGPLALELQAVGIIALAKRRGRLRRIGHDRFHPLGDGSRDVLHRARLGHDDGLEQRHRNQQHLAARLGDEIREHRVAGHQRHLVERVAGLQSAERLPRAAVAEDRGVDRAAQDHAEVRGFGALVHNGFVGFERRDARALHQGCRRSAEKSRNGPTLSLRNETMAEVFIGSSVVRSGSYRSQVGNQFDTNWR